MLHRLFQYFRLRKYSRTFLLLAVPLCASPPRSQTAVSQSSENSSFQTRAQSAAAARDAGNANEALREYREALQLDPNWQEGWWNVGTLEYERDHYVEAIPAFRSLAKLAPQSSLAWTFLGLCEFETKDYASALDHLLKAQSLGGVDDPEIARVAQYHLALLLIRNGAFENGNEVLTRAIGSAEIVPQLKTALGLCLLRVPLLPNEVDPSHEALIQEAGEAAALLAGGNSARSLAALKALIAKYPDVPYLHYVYGQALATGGDSGHAVEQFRIEETVSPKSVLPKLAIAQINDPSNHPQAAPKTPQEFDAQNPPIELWIVERYAARADTSNERAAVATSGDEIWNAAMRDYSAKRYTDAIAALKTWLQQNPKSGTGWAVLGLSEFALHDYDNALIHLERGQQLGLSGSPDSVQLAKYRLGILLNNSGQFNNAEQVLMSATGPGALEADIKFALGMASLRIRALPDEIAVNQQALVAATGEITVLLKDSKYDAAFAGLASLLKKYPSAPFLHYVYGTALASLSQFDEATKQFHEEMRLSPSSELPYIGIASLELKRHRPADALESAQRAVQLAPQNATAHYLLGRSYLETGKEALAIIELQAASAITPGSPAVHFSLAKAYARNQEPEKAEQERAIFTQLNALAEHQRGQQGNQSYGAHDATDAAVSTIDQRPADQRAADQRPAENSKPQ
jgi:tetratricopeptide (TPR) repeat protein